MYPPFSLTPDIVALVATIERLLGRIEGMSLHRPPVELRRSNQIKTIQGSLAIEGNSLTEQQITALIEGKPVIGSAAEIQEVINALQTYEGIGTFNPLSIHALLKAHGQMMSGLIPDAGQWRQGNVGIYQGTAVTHMAPPAVRVPELMDRIFAFLGTRDQHPLIQSCIFHYELEFIHPFSDGNGRIGRFWHSVLLRSYQPLFEYIPIESLIKRHQSDYYAALRQADAAGISNGFVAFMLGLILQALEEYTNLLQPQPLTTTDRLDHAAVHFGALTFSRRDYLSLFPDLSTATASRDLAVGVKEGRLKSEGKQATTRYLFLAS